MGAGNACVFGDYEGLYYVDWAKFPYEFENSDGEIVIDYQEQREAWVESLWIFKEDMKDKFPSFSDCDKWLSNNVKAVLENELFYIATEDNQWSMAIKLLQKEQGFYDSGNIYNLQGRHYKNYLEGMKECLFNQFEEIGVCGGPWTSGTIKREN